MRQLWLLAEGAWGPPALLAAILANVNSTSKSRGRAFEPRDFNPFQRGRGQGRREGIPIDDPKEMAAVLRAAFGHGKKRG